MFNVIITKQMISQAICEKLCGIAEMNQDNPSKPTDRFILVREWNSKGALSVTYDVLLEGFHCYDTERIPSFISEDWDVSFLIYKKLKGL